MSMFDWAADSSEEEEEEEEANQVISPVEKTDPASNESNNDDNVLTTPIEETVNNGSSIQGDHNGDQRNDARISSRHHKPIIFPEKPPYTAFVGNLAYSIDDPKVFANKILELVRSRLGEEIVITAQRVAIDRQGGNRPKGFGYIEVETLEHVSIFVHNFLELKFLDLQLLTHTLSYFLLISLIIYSLN
jgi:hypothetical protein